jgi:tryptophan halogenase
MKIVIVGWWTAGWLTALYLQKFVGESQVTLLASPDIGIIGVGEATLPNFSDFLHQVDIDEHEFMIESSASYKVGIQFINWSATMPNFNVWFDVWMTKIQYGNIPFSNYWKEYFQQYNYGLINDPSSLVIQNRRAPYTSPNIKWLSSYAFHFDTVKVWGFLKNKAISRWVSYIETTISRVIHNEDAWIKELIDK